MRVLVLRQARDDLAAARDFYDSRQRGVGDYFATVLAADLESLRWTAGIHPRIGRYYRALSRRFPFGIFYLIEEGVVRVYAVLDLRRDPACIRRRLGSGEG